MSTHAVSGGIRRFKYIRSGLLFKEFLESLLSKPNKEQTLSDGKRQGLGKGASEQYELTHGFPLFILKFKKKIYRICKKGVPLCSEITLRKKVDPKVVETKHLFLHHDHGRR